MKSALCAENMLAKSTEKNYLFRFCFNVSHVDQGKVLV